MRLKITNGGITFGIDADSFCVLCDDDANNNSDPQPPMEFVAIKTPWHSYKIGKYPVTVAQWNAWKGIPTPEEQYMLPITNVSAIEAEKFCSHFGWRLPTEDEWEFAAIRGVNRYPWGHARPNSQNCNSQEHGPRRITPVDAYPLGSTPDGIYDLLGNTWEWMAAEKDQTKRVLRGGSWIYSVEDLRASFRYRCKPDNRNDLIGFRCARDVEA